MRWCCHLSLLARGLPAWPGRGHVHGLVPRAGSVQPPPAARAAPALTLPLLLGVGGEGKGSSVQKR